MNLETALKIAQVLLTDPHYFWEVTIVNVSETVKMQETDGTITEHRPKVEEFQVQIEQDSLSHDALATAVGGDHIPNTVTVKLHDGKIVYE